MFDKLIVTAPEGADFKNRRTYFLVSSLVVGVVFVTAVVISIFAADIGLGNSSFELVEMIAPPEMAPAEPQPQQPPRQQLQTQSQSPTRQANIARMDETPPTVPTTASVVKNTQLSRPLGDFKISSTDSNPVGLTTSGRDVSGTAPTSGGLSQSKPVVDTTPDQAPPPPQIKKDPKPKPLVSKGVLNGEAKSLPKPAYPAVAKIARAHGQVAVQVTIDETGNVISAHAVNGHAMLRTEAEKAARNARFSPTLLSNVPVKITGIITYNFVL